MGLVPRVKCHLHWLLVEMPRPSGWAIVVVLLGLLACRQTQALSLSGILNAITSGVGTAANSTEQAVEAATEGVSDTVSICKDNSKQCQPLSTCLLDSHPDASTRRSSTCTLQAQKAVADIQTGVSEVQQVTPLVTAVANNPGALVAAVVPGFIADLEQDVLNPAVEGLNQAASAAINGGLNVAVNATQLLAALSGNPDLADEVLNIIKQG